jgi:hypothetical protein
MIDAERGVLLLGRIAWSEPHLDELIYSKRYAAAKPSKMAMRGRDSARGRHASRAACAFVCASWQTYTGRGCAYQESIRCAEPFGASIRRGTRVSRDNPSRRPR